MARWWANPFLSGEEELWKGEKCVEFIRICCDRRRKNGDSAREGKRRRKKNVPSKLSLLISNIGLVGTRCSHILRICDSMRCTAVLLEHTIYNNINEMIPSKQLSVHTGRWISGGLVYTGSVLKRSNLHIPIKSGVPWLDSRGPVPSVVENLISLCIVHRQMSTQLCPVVGYKLMRLPDIREMPVYSSNEFRQIGLKWPRVKRAWRRPARKSD